MQRGAFLDQAVEFRYRMFAKQSTLHCLDVATCMPVGGYSVWGGFAPISNASSAVMLVARMDGSGLFHEIVPAADSAVSGTVALLAAVQALSKVRVLNAN